MEVRYYKKGKDPYYLYIALFDREGDSLISTGERISKADWKAKRWPKKAAVMYADILHIKDLLEDLREDVTPTTVKAAFERERLKKEQDLHQRDKVRKEAARGVSKLASDWVSNHLFGYKPSTQKAVKESIDAFKEFLKREGQATIERKDLSPKIISRYEKYLQEIKKLSNSTHGKRIKHLRWFLKSLDFDVSKIKIRSFKKQIIALTLPELEALEAVEPETTDEKRAKDMFLLGCYTGQRISDLKRITLQSIAGNEIKLRQQKTGNDISFPVTQEILAILERHEGKAPRITEQDLNSNIKTLCDRAKINSPVTVVTNKAGLNVTSQEMKYKLITSHVSGKTFISTVATERYKLTPPEIAAICGKSLKTLLSNYFSLPHQSAKEKILKVSGPHTLRVSI